MNPDDFDQLNTEIDNVIQQMDSEEEEKEEFTPPKDGSWVPRGRLDDLSAKYGSAIAELDKANAKIQQYENKSNTQNSSKTGGNLEEVLGQLEAGEATERDVVLAIRDELLGEVQKNVQQSQTKSRVDQELDRYTAQYPDLNDKTSELYQKVADEYDYMQRFGASEGDSTILAALRSTLGALDGKSKKKVKASRMREPYMEQAGDAGAGGGRESSDPLKKLNNKQKRYYSDQIRNGTYTDWAAVREELTWARGKKKKKSD